MRICFLARMRYQAWQVVSVAVVGATAACVFGQDAASELEGKFVGNPTQLTSDWVKAGEGYFSPDGQSIVYQAVKEGYPFYQIYTQSQSGDGSWTEPLRISTGRGRTTCSYFSPDGERILLASSHLDPNLAETEQKAVQQEEEDRRTGRRRRYSWDFDPHMDLFEATRDGKLLRQLTNTPGYDAEGAYSPDGKQIVFCSDRDGDPDLYIMDVESGDARQITNEPGYDGGPFFSPDGEWVIFRTDREKADYLQVHAIRADGTGDVALTNNDGVNWAPYWHPTEPYIIWTGADHSNPSQRPNYDLWLLRYRIDDDGLHADGEPVRVTDHQSADVLPVFSPDGKRLMWTSGRGVDGTSQLWIADFSLQDGNSR